MSTLRVYAHGQVTLPKAVRDRLGIRPGDSVVIEERHGEAVLRKPRGILESNGMGAPRDRVDLEHAREVARMQRVRNRLAR